MGNTQGTHYFLNINSGRRVARNHWTVLPMPNEIIQAVNRLAAANKKHRGIVFTDKFGNVINDNSPEELDKAEITGVSTGVGNINNTENTGVGYINDAESNINNTQSTGVGYINDAESTEVGNTHDLEDNTQEYEQENINTGNTETNNT